MKLQIKHVLLACDTGMETNGSWKKLRYIIEVKNLVSFRPL